MTESTTKEAVAGRDAAHLGREPELDPPFEVIAPLGEPCGLVFSSPHSGCVYPERFLALSRLEAAVMRRSEDAYVDALFSGAARVGAPLLRARFPRAYLDLNREPYELDPRLFDGPLPGYANTRSLRVAAGLGTIPRVVADAREIYAARLPVDEALRRVEALYRPYHAALRGLMNEARDAFGFAVLVDCHSMPSSAPRELASGRQRPDFVVGDRFGASAAPWIVETIEQRLRGFGYHVLRNRPYAGGFITEHYGRPAQSWHAVQIEISRGLYMNEATLEPNAHFAALREELALVAAELAEGLANGAVQPRETRAAAE